MSIVQGTILYLLVSVGLWTLVSWVCWRLALHWTRQRKWIVVLHLAFCALFTTYVPLGYVYFLQTLGDL